MTTSPVVSVTDELIAELDDLAHCGPEELTISAWTIAALLAERAELKRDAERINWLQEQFKTCTLDMGGNHPYSPSSIKLRGLRGPTFRSAIDAAMHAEASQ